MRHLYSWININMIENYIMLWERFAL